MNTIKTVSLLLALTIIIPSLDAQTSTQRKLPCTSFFSTAKNKIVARVLPLLKKYNSTIAIATIGSATGCMLYALLVRKKSRTTPPLSLASFATVPLEEYQKCNTAILKNIAQIATSDYDTRIEITRKACIMTTQQLLKEWESLPFSDRPFLTLDFSQYDVEIYLISIKRNNRVSPYQKRLFLYNLLLCNPKNAFPLSWDMFNKTLDLFDIGHMVYGLPLAKDGIAGGHEIENNFDLIRDTETEYLATVYNELSKK